MERRAYSVIGVPSVSVAAGDSSIPIHATVSARACPPRVVQREPTPAALLVSHCLTVRGYVRTLPRNISGVSHATIQRPRTPAGDTRRARPQGARVRVTSRLRRRDVDSRDVG